MLVSIVTSVYNCQDYIREMLDSIMNQTFHDWECIIIDDASTDNTWDIIGQYQDERIIPIHNEYNVGLTKNLNKGIARAKGKYIVRIDGDDVAYPQRLEKQVCFMEENPEIVVSGSYMQFFGKIHDKHRTFISDELLRVNMLFGTVLGHPTFIIRKSAMDKNHICYDESLKFAQDYNLIYQLMQHGRLANIPEILVKYRIHDKQISREKAKQQLECANITRRMMLELLDIKLAKKEENLWFAWCVNRAGIDTDDMAILMKIQDDILCSNRSRMLFDQSTLEKVLKKKKDRYLENLNIDISKAQDKYFTLFLMMNQWMRVNRERKNIAYYFERKGYQKIAIYGAGYAGETLFEELKDTDISVIYWIDRDVEGRYSGIKIVQPEDTLEMVDAIIVTAVTFFDEIKANLENKIQCPIISLEDILYDKE